MSLTASCSRPLRDGACAAAAAELAAASATAANVTGGRSPMTTRRTDLVETQFGQ